MEENVNRFILGRKNRIRNKGENKIKKLIHNSPFITKSNCRQLASHHSGRTGLDFDTSGDFSFLFEDRERKLILLYFQNNLDIPYVYCSFILQPAQIHPSISSHYPLLPWVYFLEGRSVYLLSIVVTGFLKFLWGWELVILNYGYFHTL